MEEEIPNDQVFNAENESLGNDENSEDEEMLEEGDGENEAEERDEEDAHAEENEEPDKSTGLLGDINQSAIKAEYGTESFDSLADGTDAGNRNRKPKTYNDFETSQFDSHEFRQKVGKKAKILKVEKKIVKGGRGHGNRGKKKSITSSAVNPQQIPTKLPGRTRIPSEKKSLPSTAPLVVEQPKPIKEKQLNEIEDQLIANCIRNIQKAKDAQSEKGRVLPEGHEKLPSLEVALSKSVVQNTSLNCDWQSFAAKMIGCLCKVYWDGEDTWFYARVLNYDPAHDRHYIYYTSDSTAEWIQFNKEQVLVASDFILTRVKKTSGLWPGVKYWVSELGKNEIQRTKGFVEGNFYIEFFNDNSVNEYAFVPENSIFSIDEQYFPQKPSKKFLSAIDAAKQEALFVDQIVTDVKKAMIDNCFKTLNGLDWIGFRVRAETHAIVRREIHHFPVKKSKNAAENILLQDVNDLLQNESANCFGFIMKYCPSLNKHFIVFDELRLQPKWLTLERGNVDIFPEKVSSDLYNQDLDYQGFCMLCHVAPTQIDLVLKCVTCKSICHETCSPNEEFLAIHEPRIRPLKWKCWNCRVCHNCDVSIWNRSLIYWNVRRAIPYAPDKSLLLCGLCLKGFKQNEDFCTICFKLYAENTAHKHTKLIPGEQPELPSLGNVDEKCMVQCNECEKWIHAICEGIDASQYQSITEGTHPIWGEEYLCPICRVKLCHDFLEQLQHHDQLYMFAEPVTESVASNYFDVIRNPMDISTMTGKNDRGHYKSLQPFRQDVELMCLNALIFNREGDEIWMYTAHYFQTIQQLFSNSEHRTNLTAYGHEALEVLKKSNIDVTIGQPEKPGKGKKRKAIKQLERNEQTDASTNNVSSENANSAPMEISENPSDVKEESDGEELDELPTINIYLQPKLEPTSFVQPFMMLQSAEEAYYSVAIDVCLVCGSAGSADDLLFCVDCGEGFHRFCCSAPKDMNQLAKCSWRCPNCKICEVCGLATESDVENLILCECCDKAYHFLCLKPTLSFDVLEAQENQGLPWYCSLCVDCSNCKRASEFPEISFHNHEDENSQPKEKCWGFQQDLCFECRKKPLANVCIDCHREDVSFPLFRCIDCGVCFHSSCAERRSSFTSTSLCSRCQEIESNNAVTHLGTGREFYGLLHEVSEIQNIRKENKLRNTAEMKDYLTQQFQLQITDHVYELIIMSLWGNIRQLLFEENKKATDSVINKRSEILPDNSMQFMPSKARRYLNYIRRANSRANLSRKNAGEKLSYEGLLTLAALASNFTFVSDLEGVNLKHGLTEVIIILYEIAILYCRKYPIVCLSLFRNALPSFTQSETISSDPVNIDEKSISPHSFTNNLLAKIEQTLLKFYYALGISSFGVQRVGKSIQKYGHLLPVDESQELEKIIKAVQLTQMSDVKIIENYIQENFRDFSEYEKQIFFQFFSRFYGNGVGNLVEKYGSSQTMDLSSSSSSFEMKTDYLKTPISSMHKLLERFQSSRKTLICKCVKVRVDSQRIEGSAEVEELLNSQSLVEIQNNPTLFFPFPVVNANIPQPNSSLSHSQSRDTIDTTAIDQTSSLANDTSANVLDSDEQQPPPQKQSIIQPSPAASMMASQMYFSCKLFNALPISEESFELQNLLNLIRNEVLQEFDSKENLDSVDLEKMFQIYKERFLGEEYVVQNNSTEIITPVKIEGNEESEVLGNQTEVDQNATPMIVEESNLIEAEKEVEEEDDAESENEVIPSDLPFVDIIPEESSKKPTISPSSASSSDIQEANPQAAPVSIVSYRPLKGWNDEEALKTTSYELQKQTNEWIDFRSCAFCTHNIESPLLGRLVPFSDGALVHINCLLWCSEVTVVAAQLVNAENARKRCLAQTCYYCLKRGATVNCCRSNRKCKRAYHVTCAISSQCILLEKLNSSTSSSSNSSSANSSPYEAFCPEHYQELDQTSILQYQHWQPSDPTRCLVTETCTEKIEIENVATILSQGRTDVAVKSGAVTILKIGKPLLEKNGFSTTKHIYPHHFMSCRIFWSMKHPGKRTVYFFDILEKNDLENWELKQIDYLQRFLYNICQEYPIDSFSSSSTSSSNDHNNNNHHHQNDSSHKIDVDVNDLLNGAIFRVAALDSLESPLFAKSVDQLYAFLLRKIRDCSADFKSNILHIQPRKSNHSYNLTSHQFFGLGLPFVQEAIEMIPESIMTMITMNEKERYSPYFRLPSQLDIANVLKHQNTLQSMFINTTTINGASRADPYQEKVFSENISIKITQTKSTGRDTDTSTTDNNNNNNSNNNNSNSNSNNENREDYLTDINKENSKAELESRKLRFLDMTKAYIRNPYAKLEVKKSRIHGWGLFSKINYEKDDVIIEYIGEKIRQIIADYREINYEKEGVGSCYLFRLDKDEIIDATKIGGMSRFINHCCEPNAYAKVLTYENNETKEIEKHIVIFADKNIQEGEEITYDYKFPIEDKKLKCFCGAPRCSGSMN